MWRPIETMPTDGRMVRIKMSGGSEHIAPAHKITEAPRHVRLELVKAGTWPDHKDFTPTHWAPLENDN